MALREGAVLWHSGRVLYCGRAGCTQGGCCIVAGLGVLREGAVLWLREGAVLWHSGKMLYCGMAGCTQGGCCIVAGLSVLRDGLRVSENSSFVFCSIIKLLL